jgi:23S rRNA (uridine2552-2'-O)-methyltransferase
LSRYNPKDRFYKKAKQDNFVARSAYKLEEIDRRFHLFKKGQHIVDLGCAPGSWLQYLADAVGPRGLVLGYDLEMPRIAAGPTVRCFAGDVHELTADAIRGEARRALSLGASDEVRIDAVISDMAPKLTGIRDTDQARSVGLAEKALELAESLVIRDGVFVAKLFQGRGTEEFILEVKKRFGDTRLLRPEATREGSREVFIIARRTK